MIVKFFELGDMCMDSVEVGEDIRSDLITIFDETPKGTIFHADDEMIVLRTQNYGMITLYAKDTGFNVPWVVCEAVETLPIITRHNQIIKPLEDDLVRIFTGKPSTSGVFQVIDCLQSGFDFEYFFVDKNGREFRVGRQCIEAAYLLDEEEKQTYVKTFMELM